MKLLKIKYAKDANGKGGRNLALVIYITIYKAIHFIINRSLNTQT